MRKLPIFKPDKQVWAVAKQLAKQFDRTAWNGQTLGQLALQNLLPCPLPLVKRENRFATSCQLPITDFRIPTKSDQNQQRSDTDGQQTTTIDHQQQRMITIPWNMSGRPTRPDIFHWAVVWHRANQRKGLAATKNRGRVSGGGRKIYRQKGTGRARAGSSRAPQRRGGGVVFGPRPRDFSQALPAKIRRRSVMSALAMKLKAGRLAVVAGESLRLESHKTAHLAAILDLHRSTCFGDDKKKPCKLLVVDTEPFDKNISLAARMLSDRLKLFSLHNNKELVCYDILNCQKVVLTDRAVNHLLSAFK